MQIGNLYGNPAATATSLSGNNLPLQSTGNSSNSNSTIRNPSADTVTLSPQAQTISELDRNGIPKHLAIPQWITGYMHESTDLSLNIDKVMAEGKAYQEFSEKFLDDGKLTNQEQRQMEVYRRTQMSFNDISIEMDNFRQSNRYELNELSSIRNTYYQQVLSESGIESSDEYVDKVIDAPGHNVEMHKRFDELMRSNSRAVELMNQLGINPPKVS
ncbi:hypothetical protein R50073_51070 (plasmid) [Maricurvus nonylphenolicus]|uniref:hypothetical protein n=1 Tax=Maricurvus nonylphenolicus TaxID=1008307 RepID=UPI0036F310BF